MKPQNAEQKSVVAQGQAKDNRPRFQIEKLEERIAPAKGGIPGPPNDGGPGSGRGATPCTGCGGGPR